MSISTVSPRFKLAAICLAFFGSNAFVTAQADTSDNRAGLSPRDQSKVTRALARDRLSSNNSTSSNAAAAATGSGSTKFGRSKDCTTNIGSIEIQQGSAGLRVPREMITVIKAPVINKC